MMIIIYNVILFKLKYSHEYAIKHFFNHNHQLNNNCPNLNEHSYTLSFYLFKLL